MTASKSKIRKRGYINIYSKLTPQEERGVWFKTRYKKINPRWDDSLIVLCREFKKILKNRGNKSIKVLDVGCGHGNYVIDEFREKIGWAVGVDVDWKSTSRNICLDEIKYADLANLPFGDNSFDVCLSLWVLEHLKKPKIALGEIYRVLKPGGYFLFVTPNKKSSLIQLRKLIKGVWIVEKFYGRKKKDVFTVFYKANEWGGLVTLLKQSGFKKMSLKLNYDPSYTAFNELAFWFSNMMDKLLTRMGSQLTKHHLVGVIQK